MTAHARKLARDLIALTLLPSRVRGPASALGVALALEEALNADEPRGEWVEEDASVERFRLVEIE